MTGLRHLLLRHPAFAVTAALAALCMKLLVPAGYMPVIAGGGISIAICPGYAAMTPGAMPEAMAGMDHHRQDKHHGGAPEMPCGFTGLAMLSLGAVDAIVLMVPAFFAAMRAPHVAPPITIAITAHLRPPLRGPPTAA